jgi:hypothetical protein
MATTQDTFDQYAQLGFNGALNTDFDWWAASPLAEGGAIGFGVAIGFGTEDNQGVPLPTGATELEFIGVSLRTQSVENNAAGLSEYAEGSAMSVLSKGRMFVTVADGSTAGGQVYAVPDTGAIVSTTGTNIALPRARFVRTVGAGETSEIELA